MDNFLTELRELTNRHRIAIIGCGCCGSPALVHIEHDVDVYTVESDTNRSPTSGDGALANMLTPSPHPDGY